MSVFQKWLVWSSSVLTGVTGLVYWWMKYGMEPLDEWAIINHPLQPWVLKAHIIVAPAMVFALGVIASEHIWRHYRLRVGAGRGSGILTMWVIAPLILSGYLIQAVTHAGWLRLLVWAHLATGGAYLVGLVAHHRSVRLLWSRTARDRKGTPPADEATEASPTARVT